MRYVVMPDPFIENALQRDRQRQSSACPSNRYAALFGSCNGVRLAVLPKDTAASCPGKRQEQKRPKSQQVARYGPPTSIPSPLSRARLWVASSGTIALGRTECQFW